MELHFLSSTSSDEDVIILNDNINENNDTTEILSHRKKDNSSEIEFNVKYSNISTPIWEDFEILQGHYPSILLKYLSEHYADISKLMNVEEQTDFTFNAKKSKHVSNVLIKSATEVSMLKQEPITTPDYFTKPVKIISLDKEKKSVTYVDGKERTHNAPIDEFIKTDPVIFCDYIANSYYAGTSNPQ